jgi:hypothetical protein
LQDRGLIYTNNMGGKLKQNQIIRERVALD